MSNSRPNPDQTDIWKRAEAVFGQLGKPTQEFLVEQARAMLVRILEQELAKYKGKMGTPPIYFPPKIGIPETFMIVRNPKTRETFDMVGIDITILVCARGHWDKASKAKIEDWAKIVAIATVGQQYGAGIQRGIIGRAVENPQMKYASFGVAPNEFPASRIAAAFDNWMRLIDQDWLAKEEAKYESPKVVKMSDGTPLPVGLARERHTPGAKPLAVGLLLVKRYLSNDSHYDAFLGSLHIIPLTIVGEQLTEISNIPGAKERIALLSRYDTEQYHAALWELAVAGRYVALQHQVEFVPETAKGKTPDLLLLNRTPKSYVECKRSSVHSQYDLKERSEWHRICAPLVECLRSKALELDVAIRFYLPLNEIATNEVIRTFEALLREGTHEVSNERFSLVVRQLPIVRDLPYPVSQASPGFQDLLFGRRDDGSVDGFSAFISPKEISDDGLWVRSVHWRACLSWVSCSYLALDKKARGILSKIVDGSKQIPDNAHGILHLGVQEWYSGELRELRWAKIIEELGNFYHSSSIRMPYLFLNRLISRVNSKGGPDFEENCVSFHAEGVGNPSEAKRLPLLIFTAQDDCHE